MSQLSQSSHQYSIEEADVILQSQLIDLSNSTSVQTTDEKKEHSSQQKINGVDGSSDIDQNTDQNLVCGSLNNQQIVNFIPSFPNSNSNTNDHNTPIQNFTITKQQPPGVISKPKSDSKENDLLKKIKNKKTNSKNKSTMESKSQRVNQSKQSLSVEGTKSNKNRQKNQIQRLVHRKKIPQALYSESQDQPSQNKPIPVRNFLNYKPQAISNYIKNKYRKKNYNFEDKITSIKDIRVKLNDNGTNLNLNVKGEIIFIWERQLLNQKWAKTEMICIQVYDGSGSVIVAIPVKYMATNGSNLQFAIGKCVQIIRVQVREKYPHKICLLVGQKSVIKIIHRNLLPKQALIQPQKLGLTIKQVQQEPIGRYCNIVCLILKKSQKQYIRNFKNIDLNLSLLTVYDPIEKKSIVIKLWQERADLHFYTNAVVYLLRGVQIRQFKGVRQYHSSKDFNYRVLSWSMIEQYLLPLYEEREKKIQQIPEDIKKMSVKDSLIRLERYHRKVNKLRESEQQKKQKIMRESYPQKSKQIHQNFPQQSTVNRLWEKYDSNKKNPLNLSAKSAKYKIPEQEISEILKQKVHVVWSICTIKILAIEIKSNYTIKYSKCSACMSRIMRNCFNELICFKCDKNKNSLVGSSYQFGYKNAQNFYSIKCQFFDGEENYFGQICQKAGNKIFSVEDQPMKLEFFQQTNITFKQLLVKQVIGDAVRAVVMSTKQKIDLQDDIQDENCEKKQQGDDEQTKIKLIEKQKWRYREKMWVNGHYIVDILPFEDENQTTSHSIGLNHQQFSLTMLK